jgi:hypothetical protein
LQNPLPLSWNYHAVRGVWWNTNEVAEQQQYNFKNAYLDHLSTSETPKSSTKQYT